MDRDSSTRAAKDRTRWKRVGVRSSVVPQTALQGYGIHYRIDSAFRFLLYFKMEK